MPRAQKEPASDLARPDPAALYLWGPEVWIPARLALTLGDTTLGAELTRAPRAPRATVSAGSPGPFRLVLACPPLPSRPTRGAVLSQHLLDVEMVGVENSA